MPKSRDIFTIVCAFLLSAQWIVLHHFTGHLPSPYNAIAPGLAIFGAAFMLSWGAELAQFYIPQSLALAFLALVAVLPEYAVDMYFAWEAGKDPQYIHYATANMTGANRLLIGVGWASVVFAYFFKSKKGEVRLATGNRVELLFLFLATLYSFVIPLKQSLSWADAAVYISLFTGYMIQSTRAHHEEPDIEGPIEFIGHWKGLSKVLATFFFFGLAGYTIFIAAEPFAEGILEVGRKTGVEEFILVQWLAPLASESPEFIVAILFALRLRAGNAMQTLISSKVNQWTLLIGMLPLVYSLSAGHLQPMPLDERQAEEIFLTAAQSLLALVMIMNLRFSITEALILFVLFITQMFFTSTEARNIYAFLYVLFAIGWFVVVKDNRVGFLAMLRDGIGDPKKIVKGD